MSGFGGAGAFSDGKYNITNDFGGTLYSYIGKKKALELMHPDAPNRSAQAIVQLSAYLSGRDVKSLKVQKLQKTNTSGAGGTKQQETATIFVTMEDEEQFYLAVSYLIDNNHKGFVSFQLILGMV